MGQQVGRVLICVIAGRALEFAIVGALYGNFLDFPVDDSLRVHKLELHHLLDALAVMNLRVAAFAV